MLTDQSYRRAIAMLQSYVDERKAEYLDPSTLLERKYQIERELREIFAELCEIAGIQ